MELMVKDNINNLWDKILIEENFNRRIWSRIYSQNFSEEISKFEIRNDTRFKAIENGA